MESARRYFRRSHLVYRQEERMDGSWALDFLAVFRGGVGRSVAARMPLPISTIHHCSRLHVRPALCTLLSIGILLDNVILLFINLTRMIALKSGNRTNLQLSNMRGCEWILQNSATSQKTPHRWIICGNRANHSLSASEISIILSIILSKVVSSGSVIAIPFSASTIAACFNTQS